MTTTEYRKDSAAIAQLSPQQFAVTQKDATEPAFRNEFWNNHDDGIYVDIVSGRAPLLVDRQVRERYGVAELHSSDRTGEPGGEDRSQLLVRSYRGAICERR